MKSTYTLFIIIIISIGIVGYIIYLHKPSLFSDLLAFVNQEHISSIIVPSNSKDLYPNPSLTPGEIFQNATASEICQKGYTATVRNISIATKREVYAEYGLSYPQPKGAYEVDHFIPLELGGSNDVHNLWPESASPTPGFHQKDVVENYLHVQVCNNNMMLSEAQHEIQTEWYAIYQKIPDTRNYLY